MSSLKAELYNKCVEHIEDKISMIREAIDSAKEGANNETKSSAGDKHETGRAQMQLEQEKLSYQLAEAFKLKETLTKINPEIISEVISLGSLAITGIGNYYISIGAGKLEVRNKTFFAVSPAAPVAIELIGKRVNDKFTFNGKQVTIEQVL